MKKIALTLGAAVVAITALQAPAAQAGVNVHLGWRAPHWKVYYGSPYYYGYPKYHCFWKKQKFFTPHGWHWKKVKVCKPFYFDD